MFVNQKSSTFRRVIADNSWLNWFYRSCSKLVFRGSREYWEGRYSRGRSSGSGSYGVLSEFKARVLNDFVETRRIETVMEFGCGDGHQLSLARYPSYIGFDVSKSAVRICIERFRGDPGKSFFLYDPELFIDNHNVFSAQLGLSLDVIYHLVEDDVFDRYMRHLFDSSSRFVVIYSSNQDDVPTAAHVKHRKFTDWIDRNAGQWRLVEQISNEHPDEFQKLGCQVPADFYVFELEDSSTAPSG